MTDNPREALSTLLRNLRSDGSFSTRRHAPVDDLVIEVKGVGELRLPVTASQAKQLRLVARPAKYGHGEQTILDRRVRDTWEIPRSRVRIDNRRWQHTLRPMLDTIRDDLGLPPTSSLEAELQSVLLYEPQQFFAPHQDSEKNDQMIGTLVVLLPSRSTGGELVVEHRGDSVQHHGSASSLTFVAFYADTRHEVLPVVSGYRVVLTYNLLLAGVTSPTRDNTAALTATSAELLNRHFSQTPEPRWHGDRQALEPPDRLIVLLDHQYTERGLRWSQLKGDDAARAIVLRHAAERANCEMALAQAEIHETRDCYDDEPPRWRRGGWSQWDDDDSDETPDSDITLGEILDSTVTIVPAASEALRFDSEVNSDELAEVTPTGELAPYDSEYTGYMGNWGNTMDRWYRRAAIVIWPRDRSFAIRAKGDPIGALDDLLTFTATDESTPRARADDVATLLRFWPDAVRRGEQHRFLPKTLRLCWELGDEHLATRLLEPFAIEAVAPTDATALVAIAGQHGVEWFKQQISSWVGRRHASIASPAPTRASWIACLPELCTNLGDDKHAPGGLGTDLARTLTNRLGDWLISAVEEAALITTPSRRQTTLGALAAPTLAVLCAAAIGDEPQLRDQIVGAICDPTLRNTPMLVEVVRASAALPTVERDAVGVSAIAQHCQSALEAELAEPARAGDDWSITEFRHGNCCADCTTLAAFLTDTQNRQLTWPLAKPRRQHVHHRIDEAELPVTHRTTRQGSPHKLVLTKASDLHVRDSERRRAARESLHIVQQIAEARSLPTNATSSDTSSGSHSRPKGVRRARR